MISSTSVTRELLLLAGAFGVASVFVTLLAGAFTIAGVENPPRMARKPLVPVFVLAWLLLARISRRELPNELGLSPRTHALRYVLLGVACGAE